MKPGRPAPTTPSSGGSAPAPQTDTPMTAGQTIEHLNADCQCVTLDLDALCRAAGFGAGRFERDGREGTQAALNAFAVD